jgi:DNA-binding response OmpR family regulator
VDCAVSARVVIADDDEDIRGLVTIAARKAGLDVLASVSDGDAALEAIRDRLPDLAILDVAMPGLTGVEICRIVRADVTLASVRILLVSASADEASVRAGLESGAADYLSKPFSPRDLTARLSAQFPEGSE